MSNGIIWPELDASIRRRDEEHDREMREINARDFLERLEKEMAEQQELKAALEPWNQLLPVIEELSRPWRKPVYQHLQRVGRAYWRIPPNKESYMSICLRLSPGEPGEPPVVCWQAHYQKMYYSALFTVKLRIKPDGEFRDFQVQIADDHILTTEVDMDALKSALVTAFERGPASVKDRERLKGIDLPIETEG